MRKNPQIVDAFIGDSLVLYVEPEYEPDTARLAKDLEELKVTFKSAKVQREKAY